MKFPKAKMETAPKAMGGSAPMSSGMNEQAPGVFSAKHFGHVKKVASALHGSDPFKYVK